MSLFSKQSDIDGIENMKSGQMYKYYALQDELPTGANFLSSKQLEQYQAKRQSLFKVLNLPAKLFNKANILEFGPDSGENALVFASYGANLNLVEPNHRAVSKLLENFELFNLQNHIEEISAVTFQDFITDKQFDLLIAEGFIFTLKPNQFWLEKCFSLLDSRGLFLFSYMELAGSTFEMLLKMIYRSVAEYKQEDTLEIAELLYKTKWDSVDHTRSFKSWYMDVIKNPYASYDYLNSADNLLQEATQEGFSLYSSWPCYQDGLHVIWHKAKDFEQIYTDKTIENIRRSRLSYFFGKRCFYTGNSLNRLEKIATDVTRLVFLLDKQSQMICVDNIQEMLDIIKHLHRLLTTEKFYFEEQGFEFCLAQLHMLQNILTMVQQNNIEMLINYCNSDAIFIRTWGMPNHIVVLQKN